jgi:hypothetical protein
MLRLTLWQGHCKRFCGTHLRLRNVHRSRFLPQITRDARAIDGADAATAAATALATDPLENG